MNPRETTKPFRSIKFSLIILLLGLTTLTVIAIAFIAITSTQSASRRAEEISTDALRNQAQDYLVRMTKSSAKENDLILNAISSDTSKLAVFAAQIFENPNSFQVDQHWPFEAHIFQGPDGQYLNSREDISSAFVPATKEMNDNIRNEIELSAYLDLIFPVMMESSPNIEAIYFATPNDMTRYYPNIGLGEVVPPDFQASQRVWFTGSTLDNNPQKGSWWTPVYVDATGLGLVTTAAAPVYNSQQELIGVVGFDVTLADMVSAIESNRVLDTGYSFLIDETGHAIALPDMGYLDILGRAVGENEINTDLSSTETPFSTVIKNMMAGESGFKNISIGRRELFVAYAPLESAGWSLGSVVEAEDITQALANIEAELEQTTRSLVFTRILPVSIAILFLVVVIALMVTNRMTRPVQKLAQAAQSISSGEWNVEIPETRNDEIGLFAQAFKEMAEQLHEVMTGLEQRVAERTKDLERRSTHLQVASEVARDAAAVRQLDVLLNRGVNIIRDRFGFYHAGIFLLDENNEYAILKAATGDAGKTMLEKEHRLKVGEVGLVGNVSATGQPRISLDVGIDAVHFKNPLLPETRSEMALPLKAEQRVIGVLDVQSREPNAFEQEDITILQTMADQLAVAIDNARLFQEAQTNLQQLKILYGQLDQDAWKRLGETEQISGYSYEHGQLSPLIKTADRIEEGASLVKVPLKIRGLVIGTLDVWPDAAAFGSDEVELLQGLGDRLSQALESARLFQEAQGRALREQTLNDLVAQFTRSLDFDTMLQSAVQELSRLPNVTEVSIHLGSPEDAISDNGRKSANVHMPQDEVNNEAQDEGSF